MCGPNSPAHLSSPKAIVPEEGLLLYCKPVELYNILQARFLQNPYFLQRCLRYKIHSKYKKRLNAGNVVFNYRDCNNLIQKTEVTEGFSCPFCLLTCGCFKGLRYHLCSSHDLFNFMFWVTAEFHAVNVSVKIDHLNCEIIADGIQASQKNFFFCSKNFKRNLAKEATYNSKDVFAQFVQLATMYGDVNEISEEIVVNHDISHGRENDVINPFSCEKVNGDDNGIMNFCSADFAGGIECVASSFNTNDPSNTVIQYYPEREIISDLSHAIEQSSKTEQLPSEQMASKKVIMQKRQYFHSHVAQPMEIEEILCDQDSEDEIDDFVTDLEDQRMLDDFVDVSNEEKHFMHIWNSFIRKQRVLADGHVPWACKAFSILHGNELIQVPTLFWCWKLFMIKLWNHGLLDAETMNSCNIVLQDFHKVHDSSPP